MKVRGKTILTRKNIVIGKFGAEAWARFFHSVAHVHPTLNAPISANTLIPIHTFLAFHDELMRRFFDQSDAAHFELGRESARWVSSQGLCTLFMNKADIGAFVEQMPSLWDAYFAETSSRCEVTLTDSGVNFRALGLPQQHPYFEHLVVGYMSELLDNFCANPIAATLVQRGERDYHYLLGTVALSARAASGASDDKPPTDVGLLSLSERERQVLLLVAQGKTNKEIGQHLGISAKTVQHHATRAYAKAGVSGRVDAVRWLAKRGILAENERRR